jgi:hypothetical protein
LLSCLEKQLTETLGASCNNAVGSVNVNNVTFHPVPPVVKLTPVGDVLMY